MYPVNFNIYDKELKWLRGKSNVVRIKEEDNLAWNDFILFQYGSFIESEPNLNKILKESIKSREIKFVAKKVTDISFFNMHTLLTVTMTDIEEYGGNRGIGNTIL